MIFLLAVAGAVVLILKKGPLAPVVVEVAEAGQGDLHSASFGVGTLEALRTYEIGPTRGGRVLTLSVDQGDQVQEGQLLGEMDPVDLPYRLESARRNVLRTESAISAADAKRADLSARLALARKEADRYRELGLEKQVSQDQVDVKVTAAVSLAHQLRAAEADLQALRHDLERTREDVRALEAQLRELRLVSPVAGLVVDRRVDPGSVVMAGTPVLQLIDPSTVWVRVRVDQKRSRGVRVGLPAEIRLREHPGKALPGRVARMEAIADSLTEERWVNVAFEGAIPSVPLGSLANVTIHLPPVTGVLWVPAAALQEKAGEKGVWLLDGGRATFRPVVIGVRTLDGRVEVRKGLEAGEKVIVYTARRMEEGLKVEAR